MMSLSHLIALARHPRTLVDSIFTYPRFLGAIKPGLLRRSSREIEARLGCLTSCWWPAKLRVPVGRRLLAISPHPDDETIGAGGLLLAHRGFAQISVITIFNGEGGGLLQEVERNAPEYRTRLVEARLIELQAACARFSGSLVGCLGLPDGTTPVPMDNVAEALRKLVEAVKPDVVMLPWMLDQQADHRTVNTLWTRACGHIQCMVLGTEIWSFVPANAYFDITEVLNEKLAAISEFKTQLATVDYLSLAKGLAKLRAFQYNVRERRTGAAEAYFALPNKAYCDLVRSLEA
jgi:LmbE family N-acetylglucosaminyl deacetylase